MNKYIILLIILLIAIIIYFDYKKSNIEKLTNISVINFLSRNNLNINRDGDIELKTNNGKKVGLNINRGKVNIGTQFSFDPSNNNLQCGRFNIDKQGKIKLGNSTLVDPSGNINFGDFIYSKLGKLNKSDNSLNIDPSGNINIRNFMYNTTGNLTTKDNLFQIDLSNNILTQDYEIKPNIKSFKKRDGSFEDDKSNNKIKCGNFDEMYYVSRIILETPLNETNLNPLHIASIRFYDINNNVIQPDKYTATMFNGRIYYNNKEVNSYNLFYNKTINFTSTTPRRPIIQPKTNFTQTDVSGSQDFIGHGIPNLVNQYIFDFTPQVLIKYVEIENRKAHCCWERISKASMQIFTKNERNNYDEKYRIQLVRVGSPVVIQNTISLPEQAILKRKGTIERYAITNYSATATGAFPVGYEPILRYYIQ